MTSRFFYCDTSVLVPQFLDSPVSPIARRALAECTNGVLIPIALSELTRLEFISAIAKNIRIGQIGSVEAEASLFDFDHHCRHSFTFLPIVSPDYELAQMWLRRFSTSLRTLDALHLAVAHANTCSLVTADRQLAAAAEVLGVSCRFVSYK